MMKALLTLGLVTLGFALGFALGGSTKQDASAQPLACYERAQAATTLTINDVVALCTGARDNGPVDCYIAGENSTTFSQQDLVLLCRCAEGTEPIRCSERAQQSATLTQQEIVALCAPSVQGTLYPSCEPAGTPPPPPEE
ncbi:MAG: hypothetical protein H5U40_05740 [Polyangiaceae bacterium]|nr:hypothetical protein [Polyangiaceae bacterium]